MFNQTEVIRERLSAQSQFLSVLRDRHRTWAKKTKDPGAAQIHVEIAELFLRSIEKYNILLDMYHQQYV